MDIPILSATWYCLQSVQSLLSPLDTFFFDSIVREDVLTWRMVLNSIPHSFQHQAYAMIMVINGCMNHSVKIQDLDLIPLLFIEKECCIEWNRRDWTQMDTEDKLFKTSSSVISQVKIMSSTFFSSLQFLSEKQQVFFLLTTVFLVTNFRLTRKCDWYLWLFIPSNLVNWQ